MKLKKIIPLTLGIMLLITTTSCSTIKGILLEDFCSYYDDVYLKARGAVEFEFANITGTLTINDEPVEVENRQTEINSLKFYEVYYSLKEFVYFPIAFVGGLGIKSFINAMNVNGIPTSAFVFEKDYMLLDYFEKKDEVESYLKMELTFNKVGYASKMVFAAQNIGVIKKAQSFNFVVNEYQVK